MLNKKEKGAVQPPVPAPEQPEVSVIVPVYGTEEYLPACLDSILACRGIPLEVVVIDDASPGDSEKICSRFREKDSRVRSFINTENRGLLQTRLRGVREARGRYIAFVDSDDTVGPGFLGSLYETAVRTGADIVAGRTVRVSGQGNVVCSLHENSLRAEFLTGEEVRDAFFEQEGRCYGWHTVWNKLYRRECWEASLAWFADSRRRITMAEDLCLSFQIFSQSPRMRTVWGSPYYYREREGAATATGRAPVPAVLDRLEEMCASFEEAEGFLAVQLEGDLRKERLLGHFHGCRRYYGRLWTGILGSRLLSAPQRQFAEACLKKLTESCEGVKQTYNCLPVQPLPPVGWYEKLRIPFSGRTEFLEQRIRSGEEMCVSFDLYDTLITRPFPDPKDLFVLLDASYSRLTGSAASFHTLRAEAEQRCRDRLYRERRYGDVKLREIYGQLERDYGIAPGILKDMEQEEQCREYMCAMPRETGRRLLEAALESGKRVVLVTDMYLPEQLLREILAKCGIPDTLPLYISSEERKLKRGGDLFRIVRRREKLAGEQILHIGDNWHADILGAQRAQLRCLYLPSAEDASRGLVNGQPKGRRGCFGEQAFGPAAWDAACRDPGFSAARGLAVRRYWDDPYRDLPEEKGTGGDPFYLGYCLLGPFLLGIVRGILEEADRRGCREVVFLERDADLPMLAMQILSAAVPGLPGCRSLPLSRDLLLSWMVSPVDSLAALSVVPERHSPRSVRELLHVLSDGNEETGGGPGIFPEGRGTRRTDDIKPFRNEEEYRAFLRAFREEDYRNSTAGKSRELVSIFLESLSEKSLLFDIGYSGRIPEAVCRAVEKKVPTLYLLGEPGASRREIDEEGTLLPVTVLLPLAGTSTGPLLEYLFAGAGGRCRGLSGEGEPLWDKEVTCAEAVSVRSAVRRAALEYVRNWCDCFGEVSVRMLPPCEYASLPALDFLRHFPESEQDRVLFETAGIEDGFYAAAEWVPLLSLYNGNGQERDTGAGTGVKNNEGTQGRSKLLPGRRREPETLPAKAFRMWREDPARFYSKVRERLFPW